ncbi:hypothetical protein CVT26_005437 [Gymnopilus dilepis]|uniref:DUF6589 domain-containing protein n=1 Tax=Gymnopilus dilepis TaxID=231916 RepID=A0A409WBX9_9AGAR|nr:hypothetical protein CVT26_005437 [Gymnopilus dilepis]
MPPKPTFRVTLSSRFEENVSMPPPTTSTFEIPNYSGQHHSQLDAKRKRAYQVKKTRLADWNIDTLPSDVIGGTSSSASLQGLPTPQTPDDAMDVDCAGGLQGTLSLDDTQRAGFMVSGLPLPHTPAIAHEFTLLSPFSLSRGTTQVENGTSEALLWPSQSSRLGIAPEDDAMMVDAVEECAAQLVDSGAVSLASSSSSATRNRVCLLEGSDSQEVTTTTSKVLQKRKAQVPKADTIQAALRILRDGRISFMDLLETVLSRNGAHLAAYRRAFLGSSRLGEILTTLWEAEESKATVQDWIETTGLEMESSKPLLRMNFKDISPAFLQDWDIETIMEPVNARTQIWSKILVAATEPQKKDDSDHDARTQSTVFLLVRDLTRNVISASVHYLRSMASCKVEVVLALSAWATGASRRLIEILHQSGLAISYTSIMNIMGSMAEHSMEEARRLVRQRPHLLAYDNINLSTSIFVVQTENMPNKVRSGTFPLLYELLYADPKYMELEPILSRLRKSSPLKMSDLRPSRQAAESFDLHSMINIVEVLTRYSMGFKYLQAEQSLRHPERRAIPKGHKTKFYCLRVNTIEEASVQGNILVHNDIYVNQLKLEKDVPILNTGAIPTINDQLTNSRIRGAQVQRAKDISR